MVDYIISKQILIEFEYDRYGEEHIISSSRSRRKLRAHWTRELSQKLEAYHSIDAERDFIALLSAKISAEIDR